MEKKEKGPLTYNCYKHYHNGNNKTYNKSFKENHENNIQINNNSYKVNEYHFLKKKHYKTFHYNNNYKFRKKMLDK